LKGIYYFNEP
jgi:hypothetical protein